MIYGLRVSTISLVEWIETVEGSRLMEKPQLSLGYKLIVLISDI